MRYSYKSLHEFIARLEREGELIRIKEEIDPVLEITEIVDRVSKSPKGGKALLFENVKNSLFPVFINGFGSKKRMSMSLGVNSIEEIAREIKELFDTQPPQSFIDKIAFIPKLFELAKIPPKKIKGSMAPCQEVVLTGDDVDLTKLPVLKCWPKDGGRFITLPVVFTRCPVTGKRNVGVYRMHVYDKNRTGMHWHIHKDGADHFKEYKKLNKRMELAVAVGTDPAVTYAATAPLPPGVDELLLAGFIRKKGVELVRCKTIDMEVPATAEIILEGYVDPAESKIEGPFGDHTGYYSMEAPYPVFHVTAVTHRQDAVYSATIVGKPPMEDCYMGKATERIFLPMLKMINNDIEDISLPWEGVFHNCAIVSIKKRYPYHARQTMSNLWGAGQMSFSKMIIAMNAGINIHDYNEVARYFLNRVDISKDIFLSEGILDALDHSSPQGLYGSKVGIDLTSSEDNDVSKVKIPVIPSDENILKNVKEYSANVKDIAIPVRDVRTPVLFISINKKKPHEAKEIAKLFFGDSRFACFKITMFFDSEVNVKNNSYSIWKFFNNVDPKRDFHFFNGRIGIDATRKWKEEGYNREWPDEIGMSEDIKKKIDAIWGRLGIS